VRLSFQVSAQHLTRLDEQRAFADLAVSKKKHPVDKKVEEEQGRLLQTAIRNALQKIAPELLKNRKIFEARLEKALKTAQLHLAPAVHKAILSALSKRDKTADICRDKIGRPEADPELRDTENVPLPAIGIEPEREYVFDGYRMELGESIIAFFEREVKPHVPDAWINPEVRDATDNRVGKVGYEINFNRYFYTYQPPRPLTVIETEMKVLEQEILSMLNEMAE